MRSAFSDLSDILREEPVSSLVRTEKVESVEVLISLARCKELWNIPGVGQRTHAKLEQLLSEFVDKEKEGYFKLVLAVIGRTIFEEEEINRIYEACMSEEVILACNKLINRLPEEKATILKMGCGIGTKQLRPAEIGRLLGLDSRRVKRLYEEAIETIRELGIRDNLYIRLAIEGYSPKTLLEEFIRLALDEEDPLSDSDFRRIFKLARKCQPELFALPQSFIEDPNTFLLAYRYDPVSIENRTKSLYTAGLYELDLPLKITNTLYKAKIYTVEDLIKLSRSELSRTKNVGDKALRIIEEKLADVGLGLRK